MAKTDEQFKQEVHNIVGNEYNFLEVYKNAHTKLLCKHNVCGNEYYVTPSNFLRGRRCPKCAAISRHNKQRKSQEQFESEVYRLVGTEYIFLEKYKGANIGIKCKHSICDYEWEVRPGNFLFGTRCPQCNRPNYDKDDRQFRREVCNLRGNEYVFLEEYRGAKTKIKCKHNKCGHEWEVEPTSFLSGKGCPNCNTPNRDRDNEQFKQEVFNLVGDEYTFIEEYINSFTKILCKHNECGCTWSIAPNNFLNNGNRCPECAGNIKKTNSEFIEEVYNLTGDEYVFLEDYIIAKTKILCRHVECGHEYYVTPNDFLSKGTRCPQCNSSKGERKVKEYLEKNHIKFQQQYTFSDCRKINPLPFDFAVFDKKDNLVFLIEYDGIHHFEPIRFGGITLEEAEINYKNTVHNDDIKNNYCKSQNIKLTRIPYWEYEDIDNIIYTNFNNDMMQSEADE